MSLFWFVALAFILTRASFLSPVKEWLANKFPNPVHVLGNMSCGQCVPFWACLPLLLIEPMKFPLAYLISVLFVSVYDWLQPKDA